MRRRTMKGVTFFGLHFILLGLYTIHLNLTCVCVLGESSDFHLWTKQSSTCGHLDVIPTDIRTFAPWAAAIFRKVYSKSKPSGSWEFYTSGTIAGPGLVASAQAGPPGRFPSEKNPHNFLIAVGINTTDFSKHDKFAQYSRVTLVQIVYSNAVQNYYAHDVIYHLEAPLDVLGTPYVRELCAPFFILHPRNRFIQSYLEATHSVRLSTFVYGFAQAFSTPTNNSRPGGPRKAKSREWTLKVRKFVTLPPDRCSSIFRFYYGPSVVEPICSIQAFGKSGVFTNVLDKSQIPTAEDDDKVCQGPGSGFSIVLGSTWYFVSRAGIIPSMQKMRCSNKTVYLGGERKKTSPIVRLTAFSKIIRCGYDKFACETIPKCIPIYQACDGHADCADESDEHFNLCGWEKSLTALSKTQLVHHVLEDDAQRVFPKSDLQPQILTYCEPLEFITPGVQCLYAETLEEVNCKTDFYLGAKLRIQCDGFHRAAKFSFEAIEVTCTNEGEWSKFPSIVCQKECGIIPKSKVDGQYPGFPWDAAVFQDRELICSGTLIEERYILTHAKCVQSWIESSTNDNSVGIFVRPVSNNFDQNSSSNVTQMFQIKDVWISINNLTSRFRYESGVALIQLNTPAIINAKGQPIPACYLDIPHYKKDPGKIGTIISSLDEKEESFSFQNLTIVSNDQCESASTGYFRSIVEKNEFCTTSADDTEKVFEKHRVYGSGLFVAQKAENGRTKYVLRGISSGTTSNGHTMFLDVNAFSEWLLDILEVNS